VADAGLNPKFTLQTDQAGRFSAISLMIAAQALYAGEAKYIALVYGNNGRSQRVNYGGGAGTWAPWGMTSPGASHAMMFRRHMDRFGTTSEQLAHVALERRLPLGPVWDVGELLTDPQLLARQFFAAVTLAGGAAVTIPRVPVIWNGNVFAPGAVPAIGEPALEAVP
jgi:crotonobetainyl-CoA:carnitine CoA-transferase CaiB-like acyl-CoA transferase